MSVQTRISAYMRQMGISQASISKKTGISADKMCAIVNNRLRMTADEYELICKAIDKTPNDFFDVRVETEAD